MLTERRAGHNNETFRAAAGELLACYTIVRHWLHTVVVPTGAVRVQVLSCLALFDVADLLQELKFNFNREVVHQLHRAVEHFLMMRSVAYGDDSMMMNSLAWMMATNKELVDPDMSIAKDAIEKANTV